MYEEVAPSRRGCGHAHLFRHVSADPPPPQMIGFVLIFNLYALLGRQQHRQVRCLRRPSDDECTFDGAMESTSS